MEREYDSTQGNPLRTPMVIMSDNEGLRDDTRSENSRGSNGIRRISEGLGSDSGTTNRGYFSPTWRMEQGTQYADKLQQGDGSHIFRTIPLRINLQRAANQSDPHQVRQLYSSIRFSKADSRKNSSSRSEENSQAMSTAENTNSVSTYSRCIKQDNGRTKQVKYPGRLFSKERDIQSPMPRLGNNTNTGLVRNRGKQTRGQIRGNRRGRGRGRMAERIFETMEVEDLLDPPTNSEDQKSPGRLGKVQTKVNHESILQARPKMVHTLTNRPQQILYFWRELSDSEPREEDDEKEGHATTKKNRGIPHRPRVDQGRKLLIEFLVTINMTRETKQMIIEGQKYNIQKKYMQVMGVHDDWMKEKNYTTQDIMNQKILFIHTEFMTRLTRTRKTKPSSAKHHASILITIFSIIFGTVQVSANAQRGTAHSISNHQINNPRYGSTWDINQLFEHWRERQESNLLSNEELQTKLASLLMSLCFERIEEMANMDLSVSIIDDEEHTEAVCIPQNSRRREREI
ncbi:MAG: hypothetical protein EZS28_005445 [Streblomastix strix]|uniref:Uncharacterized protein n=1 Tax=Streblomastix strix TaxID=222440 RepID=A0A5J4WVL1_9EUKA|nr:MAG: hypothetical protein EZS28_005445 [Streblomastix strix]